MNAQTTRIMTAAAADVDILERFMKLKAAWFLLDGVHNLLTARTLLLLRW
jgi:CelD/BcsL family acetyltransferase involved in cellulose biosynthesis